MRLMERPKAEIIAKVLELMAKDQYRISEGEEGEGEEITIFDAPEPPNDLVLEALQQLTSMHEEANGPEHQLTLEEDWSDSWTFKFIELLFSNPQDREKVSSILQGKSYEDALLYLHDLFNSVMSDIQGMVGAGRETIRKPDEAESIVNLENWDNGPEQLATFHAMRLSKQFPKIINRAEKLSLLRTDYEVPGDVRRYIEEASKCYLYGQLTGCLMVCRSAIEFAVRDRLKTRHSSELQSFEKSQNGDSLKYLIEFAKELLPWQFKDALEDAQKVREAARRAVHVKPSDENECRDMFMLTRTVVHMLYIKPQDITCGPAD